MLKSSGDHQSVCACKINADSAFVIFIIILVGQSGQVCLGSQGDQDGQGSIMGNEGGLFLIWSGLF